MQERALALMVVTVCAACGGGGPAGPSRSAAGPSRSAMTVVGRAGYVAGALGAGSPQQFAPAIVGAWGGTWAGRFCAEVPAAADGTFSLDIPPTCFAEGEPVYLTAGGLATCYQTPFASGARVSVEILGKRGLCPAPDARTETFAFTLPAGSRQAVVVGPVNAREGAFDVRLDFDGDFIILACVGTSAGCYPMGGRPMTTSFEIPKNFPAGPVQATVYFNFNYAQPGGDARGTVTFTFNPR